MVFLLGGLIAIMTLYAVLVIRVATTDPSLVGQEPDENFGASTHDRISVRSVQEKSPEGKIRKPFGKVSSEDQKASGSGDKNKAAERPKKGPRGATNRSTKDKDNPMVKSKVNDNISRREGGKLPPKPKINKSLPVRQVMRPMWMPKPKGEGVKPQVVVPPESDQADTGQGDDPQNENEAEVHPDPDHVLKAFVEAIDFEEWEQKPLPIRKKASANQLYELSYPKLNSCKNLPENIPADEYLDSDTFLPWVHDGRHFRSSRSRLFCCFKHEAWFLHTQKIFQSFLLMTASTFSSLHKIEEGVILETHQKKLNYSTLDSQVSHSFNMCQ